VLVARRVQPGREIEFEHWAEELTRAASHFDGFLGAGLLRPGHVGEEWNVVYRFETADALADWENSSIRARLLAKGEQVMSTTNVRRVTGLETWFELPGRTAPAPPRWKMFVVSALVIFTLQLILNFVVRRVTPGLWLAPRVALIAFAITALMTWLCSRRLPACSKGGCTGREEAARGTEQLRSRRSRGSRRVAGWSSPMGLRPSFRDRTGSHCVRPPTTPNHWLGYKTSSAAILSGWGFVGHLSSNGGPTQSDDAIRVPRHAPSSFALNWAGSPMYTA
jgi:uncharacterized protein